MDPMSYVFHNSGVLSELITKKMLLAGPWSFIWDLPNCNPVVKNYLENDHDVFFPLCDIQLFSGALIFKVASNQISNPPLKS